MRTVTISIAAIVCVGTTACQAPESGIRGVLDRQVDAWNRGDIPTFMDGYWRSPDLTFSSGGTTERGWDATLARYEKKYATREQMGTLAFSDLEVFPLGADAAYVLGHWRLERGEPVGGNFSLVFRRIDGQWRIVHDHTSADATP